VGRLLGSLAIALGVLAAMTGSGTAGSPSCTIRYKASWADARNAWELRTDETDGPRCWGRLYATGDGGRTWRLVYREPTGPIADILRTSRRAGVVFPLRWQATQAKARWTLDGGRTWRRSAEIGPRARHEFAVAGRGTRLFWATERGLYRVEGWPSSSMRARQAWAPPTGRRILVRATIRGGHFGLVPGGAAAVVADATEPSPRLWLLLHRDGGNRLARLPSPTEALAAIDADALDPGAGVTIRTAWPRLAVCSWATAWARRGGDTAINIGLVVWRSRDGGRTWSAEGVPSGTPCFL
jgi:hypothetical protein